jgi:hypothetical protein
MNFDILNFKPIVINNFFTNYEIDEIYNVINNKIIKNINNNLFEYHDFQVSEHHGSFLYNQSGSENFIFSKNISIKIKEKMEDILKIELEMPGLSFQRYSLMSGNPPQLGSHIDAYSKNKDQKSNISSTSYHILSLSVPLKNNFNWDLGINTEVYQIKNNDAILFSATNSPHRRVYREFKIDEKYDVLVVRVLPKNNLIPIVESENSDLQLMINKMNEMTILEKNYHYSLKSGS